MVRITSERRLDFPSITYKQVQGIHVNGSVKSFSDVVRYILKHGTIAFQAAQCPVIETSKEVCMPRTCNEIAQCIIKATARQSILRFPDVQHCLQGPSVVCTRHMASLLVGQTSVRLSCLSSGPVGPLVNSAVASIPKILCCLGSESGYCSSPHLPT